jgi:hypothetical protein
MYARCYRRAAGACVCDDAIWARSQQGAERIEIRSLPSRQLSFPTTDQTGDPKRRLYASAGVRNAVPTASPQPPRTNSLPPQPHAGGEEAVVSPSLRIGEKKGPKSPGKRTLRKPRTPQGGIERGQEWDRVNEGAKKFEALTSEDKALEKVVPRLMSAACGTIDSASLQAFCVESALGALFRNVSSAD